MRGNDIPSKDIVLDLEPVPANILCGEILQESEEEEEQQVLLSMYEVRSNCADCGRNVLFTCSASTPAIRTLEELLVESTLNLWCVACVKKRRSSHGKP